MNGNQLKEALRFLPGAVILRILLGGVEIDRQRWRKSDARKLATRLERENRRVSAERIDRHLFIGVEVAR
jgi:hypothetical protein